MVNTSEFALMSPAAVCEVLGERLKQARLTQELTQKEVAEKAGVERKTVLNAEKGKVQLEILVAILQAAVLLAGTQDAAAAGITVTAGKAAG